VIERPVLEHEDDDVLDLVERRDGLVEVDLDRAGGGLLPAAEERAEEPDDAGDCCADGSHDLAIALAQVCFSLRARNGVEDELLA
jgi:hypothetical protein